MSVAVVVDDREPAGLVAAVRAHPDVESVEVRRLAAGDLVVRGVGFERKTPADYVGSALGRTGPDLEEQVRKLTEAYEHAYVLVEGDIVDVERAAGADVGAVTSPASDAGRQRATGVPGTSVRGSMASITARFEVPVIPAGDRERLVDVAVRLGRKHTEDPSTRPLPTGAVTGRREPTPKRMYGCIDGIGTGTAGTLYEAFPTVEALLAASMEDLLAVEGVGPKRAEAIYEALRTEE